MFHYSILMVMMIGTSYTRETCLTLLGVNLGISIFSPLSLQSQRAIYDRLRHVHNIFLPLWLPSRLAIYDRLRRVHTDIFPPVIEVIELRKMHVWKSATNIPSINSTFFNCIYMYVYLTICIWMYAQQTLQC